MIDPDIETPNPNPDEVEDDGLGIPAADPFDPAEVDEDDPDTQEQPIAEPKEE